MLGAVGLVEQIARATELHPLDLVSVLRTRLEGDYEFRRWALLPWLSNQIMREILQVLGHCWRSGQHSGVRSVVDRLGFDDIYGLVESSLNSYSARDL
jgi:hypothetical protein